MGSEAPSGRKGVPSLSSRARYFGSLGKNSYVLQCHPYDGQRRYCTSSIHLDQMICLDLPGFREPGWSYIIIASSMEYLVSMRTYADCLALPWPGLALWGPLLIQLFTCFCRPQTLPVCSRNGPAFHCLFPNPAETGIYIALPRSLCQVPSDHGRVSQSVKQAGPPLATLA